jgi:hypothetical protein
LSGGVAYRYKSIEGRLAAFSMNNLNRGLDNNIPVGFKDGSSAEVRWHYKEGDYFTVSQQYISVGYLFSNTLVDTAANPYKPGFFIKANGLYAIPQLDKLFLFGSVTLITTKGADFRELDAAVGAGYKIWKKTEIRAFYERDFGLGDDLPARDRVVIGLRQIFGQ